MGVNVLNRLVRNTTSKPQAQPTSTKSLTNVILTLLKEGHLQKAVSLLFASPEPVSYSLYAHLFQTCSSNSAIVEARKVESHLVTFFPTPPIFLLNRAIETYGKCGCLEDARGLFEEMPQRDGGSWNAIITAYTQRGFPDKALSLFVCMYRSGVYANEITFASILGSCAAVLDLDLSRQLHGLIEKYGFQRNIILGSSLVDVYGKCGILSDARKMFHEIQCPNAISWNVIVRRYLEMGDGKEAIFLFFQMLSTDIRPLHFTFSNALVACSSIPALEEGMQIHVVATKISYLEYQLVSSSLIDMYTKCGKLDDAFRIFDQLGSKDLVSWTSIVSGYALSGKTWEARKLFDEMPERNVVSWNAMLSGYNRFFQWEEALDFVFLMLNTTEDVDHVTLGLILNVCAGLSDLELGKQAHVYIYRHGFYSNVIVGNALLDMYGKCGNLNGARIWFYQMTEWRDGVSWNALLTSHARHRLSEQAMPLFSEMQLVTPPTKYTFGTLLAACANTFALEHGKQIHGYMIRHGYEMDIVIRGALVDMYSKCHCLDYALMVFKEVASRDLILWNTIILGCCHNRMGREALELFRIMNNEGMKPDHVTFQGILLACVDEGLVDLAGQCFESMSNEYFVLPRLEHYQTMIELYSRHGHMNELENFVKRMPFEPTVPMLTRMVDACREHKYSRLGDWAAKQLIELVP
ncbi:putative Pentatricopeptide repeat-containing protein [Quillaja saponaria]|uniref:Pentatricopeptide repeat-containing protein n=1 Tax=Quillaja saponaria TaxID=32244 RepID=A0AAD7KMS8_QUISA|nr:putative Pentatricopeptide repeat-containing protein [Quillaja saponaria]